MSKYLGFPNELIPMGASVLDVHNKWKTNLTEAGWQVKYEQTTVKPFELQVIPPATEAIGNADAYEFLRISTNDTVVSWQPLKHWSRAFPQVVAISGATEGDVVVTATLAGVATTYQGVAGATAEENLMGLYHAIRASTSSAWTDYSWELSFPAPQNANDGAIYILGTKAAYAAADAITGSNCAASILGSPADAGYDQPTGLAANVSSVTIDLTNGFVYFLQVCARGLALATRTTSGYFGPLHACWADHDKSLAAMPQGSPYCSPIELVVGTDDDATNCDAWGCIAAPWGLPTTVYRWDQTTEYKCGGPGTGCRLRDTYQDVITPHSTIIGGYAWTERIQLSGSFLFIDNDGAGNDFQVHRVGKTGYTSNYIATPMGVPMECSFLQPPLVVGDWYKFVGTAVDENLLTVADTIKTTRLTLGVNVTDTSLPVEDLSVFQPSGAVVIGKEFIAYTGKSAESGPGTLTGCTKGAWGMSNVKHYSGEKVYQVLWFVKIGGGLLLAGYNKPN